jgi:hypothetical protein
MALPLQFCVLVKIFKEVHVSLGFYVISISSIHLQLWRPSTLVQRSAKMLDVFPNAYVGYLGCPRYLVRRLKRTCA